LPFINSVPCNISRACRQHCLHWVSSFRHLTLNIGVWAAPKELGTGTALRMRVRFLPLVCYFSRRSLYEYFGRRESPSPFKSRRECLRDNLEICSHWIAPIGTPRPSPRTNGTWTSRTPYAPMNQPGEQTCWQCLLFLVEWVR
jgi:hypothetical protein